MGNKKKDIKVREDENKGEGEEHKDGVDMKEIKVLGEKRGGV